MTILTERIPKPSIIRTRIEHLRKALADLEFLLPVAERVHSNRKRESATSRKSPNHRQTRVRWTTSFTNSL